jgi:glycosyltransferase involved in cell wall biosynthesis
LLLRRVLWQRRQLHTLIDEHCDVLFVPGGIYTGAFSPYVAMSQNLLPFARGERQRFGLSRAAARYLLLARGQAAAFRRAAGVIFLSHAAREQVLMTTGPLRGEQVVIPLGVADAFRHPPRQQQPAPAFTWERPFRWLYVSIVNLYKHQWHVVDAVARLRRAGLPMRLDLVGGAYPPALKKLRLAMQQHDPQGAFVTYHGPQPYAELPRWYQEADGFIFASSCENMPNILLEAMASGLPIACANVEPMPEVLDREGLYFEPEEPASIAQALKVLFGDAALRKMLSAGAFARAQQYSWTRCARETFDFLAGLAQGDVEPRSPTKEIGKA